MKDPNAPKKPLSAYFLFSQEERLKVKAEYNDYSITEVAKELGRRWATIDPGVKQTYEQRYQESRRQYEVAMSAYKPSKKKKDPNAPKQPLSAYFIFSSEERLKVKAEHPSHSICEVAKELGRRWADMSPEVKQRYQQMAEEGRQKYDINMAAYRQGNYNPPGAGSGETVLGSPDPIASRTVVTTATTVGGVITQNSPATQVVAQSNPGDGSASTQQSAEGRVETVATTAVTTAEATSYSGIETSNDYSSLLQ
nr:high mobility group protein DSP1-like isoform X1 [Lepeophtheirus salmonis]XP_040565858.1 high mobility group protein DSP1-like isoform X1 [Lepeophtheirus salmonis]XP_040565859.1 high mobility group protein DSP1-like isoform X1 [Lepeophtheirus salmonis]